MFEDPSAAAEGLNVDEPQAAPVDSNAAAAGENNEDKDGDENMVAEGLGDDSENQPDAQNEAAHGVEAEEEAKDD